MSKRDLDSERLVAQKRERRRLKRLAAERRKKLQRAADSAPRQFSSKPLEVLRSHLPKELKRSKRVSKEERIHIPETFSVIADPENALRTINELVALADRIRPPKEIYFDHSALRTFDLAAEEILDAVAMEFRRTYRRRGKPAVNFKGHFPKDPAAKRFTRAVGLVKHLNLQKFMLTSEEEQDLRVLKFQSYKALLQLSEASPADRAARELVDYFKTCLAESNFTLTDDARHRLALYASEVLDNAKEHSGTDDWVLAGYLDLTTPSRICEISIFNFGRSFAETFIALPDAHFTRQFVDPFVSLHQNRGFFGSGWERDNLLTVVALQGQVSSKNRTAADTRGNGTIDLIQFFQRVHAAAPYSDARLCQMAIVTGRTYILFDGTHKMQPDRNGRQVIAFNAENDLEKPPNRSHVRCLEGVAFPGAIVSIRFPLPDAAIREVQPDI